jgi:hypothetical protein
MPELLHLMMLSRLGSKLGGNMTWTPRGSGLAKDGFCIFARRCKAGIVAILES